MRARALYFNGETSRREDVELEFAPDNSITLLKNSGSRHWPIGTYHFDLPIGKSAIRIRGPEGSLVEAPYASELYEALRSISTKQEKVVSALEERWPAALGLFGLAVLVCACLYLYGLPIASRTIKPFIPFKLKQFVGEQVLTLYEKAGIGQSQLSEIQKAQFMKAASDLTTAAAFPFEIEITTREWKLHGTEIENAFALLPEKIVVSDALVNHLSIDETQAIVAHEIGHLYYDHGTEHLIRSSLVSILSIALFGGDPGTVQAVAFAMLDAKYSQSHETEADLYATALLKKINKRPQLLGEALKKITADSPEYMHEKYFSSHPLTSERKKRLETE